MREKNEYFVKIATEQHEFQQIHHLNYETFVKEIPQHEQNELEILIDPYNSENTYIICLKENQVVGMVAVRDKRPFSIDKKIGPVENTLPVKAKRICEIRLLSVVKEYRNGRVFLGLAQFMSRYCLKKGYEAAVISGTVRQLKLYDQMGFKPFASLTGSGDALYQPMYLTKDTFDRSIAGRILKPTLNFLPGPIKIAENVKASLSVEPISHRSIPFKQKMEETKKRLCDMVKSKYVEILLGSGTLTNDVISGQLSLLKQKGLILINGEFGERLKEHGDRMGLNFMTIKKNWGEPFSKTEIMESITGETAWIWAVHSETSTGMLNDLNMLKEIADKNQIKLCVDCISSIGAVPIDLTGVYLASGVSGKAIGAFTGLSFVFHQHLVKPSTSLPRYLDLGIYSEMDSIPYSHSSNLLEALQTALEINPNERYEKIKKTYRIIKEKLEAMGLSTFVKEQDASPSIITIEVPDDLSSREMGETLCCHGYQLHYESSYLQEKNWIQIACISDHSETDIVNMLHIIELILQNKKSAVI